MNIQVPQTPTAESNNDVTPTNLPPIIFLTSEAHIIGTTDDLFADIVRDIQIRLIDANITKSGGKTDYKMVAIEFVSDGAGAGARYIGLAVAQDFNQLPINSVTR